jgi:ribosome-binding protein aMBF1 (putative translation factor)
MIFKFPQVQIGQRIIELRKRKQLSQEDLAKWLEYPDLLTSSRASNRSLNIMELQSLLKYWFFT